MVPDQKISALIANSTQTNEKVIVKTTIFHHFCYGY